MFSQHLFNLISHLIFSRRAHSYAEHNGPQEDTCTAQIGLLHLDVNHCFVLDHRDAGVHVRIPTPWGQLHLGYMVCLGAEQIRQPGGTVRWWPRYAK